MKVLDPFQSPDPNPGPATVSGQRLVRLGKSSLQDLRELAWIAISLIEVEVKKNWKAAAFWLVCLAIGVASVIFSVIFLGMSAAQGLVDQGLSSTQAYLRVGGSLFLGGLGIGAFAAVFLRRIPIFPKEAVTAVKGSLECLNSKKN